MIALMPTASTSQILGNNECFEPFTSNLYTRGTLSGTYIISNKHLVRDLEEIGMWTEETRNALMRDNGSVINLPIPSGGSLDALAGKVVLETTDVITVTCDTLNGIDTALSVMEIT